MPTDVNSDKTVPPGKAMVNAGWVAPTINNAIETFRAARRIASHARVVKSVLRLFDQLVKCDEVGVLKGIKTCRHCEEGTLPDGAIPSPVLGIASG